MTFYHENKIFMDSFDTITLCKNFCMKKERQYFMYGKVKWFNNTKGYGFIEYPNHEDIFVHYSAIKMNGYKTLNEGDMVEFELITTEKGLQAKEVMTLTASYQK